MPGNAIDKLLDTTPTLWKGRRPNHGQCTLPSGHARLDDCLPGNGWPVGAVTEIIAARPGLGELSLLLPALARLGADGQWVVLVDPPWVPCPSALHGRGLPLERLLLVRSGEAQASLWACEQALRSGRGGAVLAWPERITFAQLRRLQLAAREKGKLGFVFRSQHALRETSPAALRLHLEPALENRTRVRVVKCRGSQPPAPVDLRLSPYANTPSHPDGHALSRAIRDDLLAGHPPAAPRARPAQPRSERGAQRPGDQRHRTGPRTDH